MHHRRPAAPHSHRPNHRQINRLMPFTTAPLFHALQLLETGDSARFTCPAQGEPVFNTYADIFAIDFTETYGTGNLYTGEVLSAMRRLPPRGISARRTAFF